MQSRETGRDFVEVPGPYKNPRLINLDEVAAVICSSSQDGAGSVVLKNGEKVKVSTAAYQRLRGSLMPGVPPAQSGLD